MAVSSVLDIRSDPLPEKEGHDLALWLAKPEGKAMIRVVEGKMRQHLAEAMAPAMDARDHPLKLQSTDSELAKVHRYQTFLDVWNELREQTAFTVNKWQNPA